nr:hypothetical protein [Bacteroidota bacterium]
MPKKENSNQGSDKPDAEKSLDCKYNDTSARNIDDDLEGYGQNNKMERLGIRNKTRLKDYRKKGREEDA